MEKTVNECLQELNDFDYDRMLDIEPEDGAEDVA
jgi:hypothetical protein